MYDLGKVGVGYATNNPVMVNDGLVDLACDTAALLIPYAPAGSTKVARLSSDVAEVGKSADAAADAALAAGKKSGAAAELRVGDKVYTGVSGEVVKPNDKLTGILMGNREKRADWHGGCAEIVCLDKALNDGVDVSGGTMKAINIGNRYAPHKSPKKICDSCSDALNQLNVNK
ncbi:hypothetical protein [Vibrio tetraodonis]|uniref:hypothetical protein n=1 Tax=Vibrio tetraodonis TaxID=2231647 RepID=UPI001F3D1083|nr:hypothetical protein [Vibrio tetraodonis]